MKGRSGIFLGAVTIHGDMRQLFKIHSLISSSVVRTLGKRYTIWRFGLLQAVIGGISPGCSTGDWSWLKEIGRRVYPLASDSNDDTIFLIWNLVPFTEANERPSQLSPKYFVETIRGWNLSYPIKDNSFCRKLLSSISRHKGTWQRLLKTTKVKDWPLILWYWSLRFSRSISWHTSHQRRIIWK